MEGIAALLGSENGLRYKGVSQLQSHQSRYSVQLSIWPFIRLGLQSERSRGHPRVVHCAGQMFTKIASSLAFVSSKLQLGKSGLQECLHLNLLISFDKDPNENEHDHLGPLRISSMRLWSHPSTNMKGPEGLRWLEVAQVF